MKIIEAINEIKIKEFDEGNFREFLETLKDDKTQDTLEKLDLIDDEIGNVIPHFRDVSYNIEERIVRRDDEIIKKLPVALIQIGTFEQNETKKIIELLDDDIDAMIDGLQSIKTELRKLEKDNANV